jgi:hypothetical protein
MATALLDTMAPRCIEAAGPRDLDALATDALLDFDKATGTAAPNDAVARIAGHERRPGGGHLRFHGRRS